MMSRLILKLEKAARKKNDIVAKRKGSSMTGLQSKLEPDWQARTCVRTPVWLMPNGRRCGSNALPVANSASIDLLPRKSPAWRKLHSLGFRDLPLAKRSER